MSFVRISSKAVLLAALALPVVLAPQSAAAGMFASKSYAISKPTPSGLEYDAVAAAPTQLLLVDARSGEELEFSKGTLPAGMTIDDKVVEPFAFLGANLQQEFESRHAPISIVSAGEGLPRVTLHAFRMRNSRKNAFSPFVTMTYLAADIENGPVKKRVGVFVKRGVVPKWGWGEIVEPTLNQPLSLAVRELSSKIADVLAGARVSDATVDSLLAKSAARTPTSYIDVYSLGFTNNPKVVPTLVELSKDADEYIRLAAISSLGTVHAADQFDYLKSIYTGARTWQDRGMALKSIGDLDTEASRAFLAETKAALEAGKSKESDLDLAIIRLYI